MESCSVYYRCRDSNSINILHQQLGEAFCFSGTASDDDVGGSGSDTCRVDELYRALFQRSK